MRPRTREYLEQAKTRLRSATLLVDAGVPPVVVSLAYYAMLYAARAALSERNVFVRQHTATWHLLRRSFVDSGELDPTLYAEAAATQTARKDADYGAKRFSDDEARAVRELAERFVAAVEEMVGD